MKAVVLSLYAALTEGNLAATSALLHPEFAGRVTEGLLDIGGVHASPDAMRRNAWGRMGKHFRVRVEASEFHELDDGRLLVMGRYVGSARNGGGRLDAAFMHVIRFKDEQIIQLIQLTDSQRFAEALARPAAIDVPRRELSRITFHVVDGVAHIHLNRPRSRNAINEPFNLDLHEVAMRCTETIDLRAVLITAAGPSFTVGGDVTLFAGTEPTALPDLLRRMTTIYGQTLGLFWNLDVPIIASVHGAVAGGGLGLIHVADIVLATASTKLALGFGHLGLSGDGGNSWFLPRLAGLRRTASLYYENQVLSAAEAVACGLISRIVPGDTADDAAWVLARKLASGPATAYAEIRALLRNSHSNSLNAQLAAETAALGRTAATADAAEGIAAFAAKREPTFGPKEKHLP